jgi:hypothetical protein
MILEGIVTTLSPERQVNIAPMGPEVNLDMRCLVLRPFRTAQTYRNLKAHGEGVFHVTDNAYLLAQAAIGAVEPLPELIPANRVSGFVLREACRYYEFQVRALDDREERARIDVEVLYAGRQRDFFGFNRAKHAILEAAILATRTAFLPLADIEAEYRKLGVIVAKTGGADERRAFALLQDHLARVVRQRAQAAVATENGPP